MITYPRVEGGRELGKDLRIFLFVAFLFIFRQNVVVWAGDRQKGAMIRPRSLLMNGCRQDFAVLAVAVVG